MSSKRAMKQAQKNKPTPSIGAILQIIDLELKSKILLRKRKKLTFIIKLLNLFTRRYF